MHIKHTKRVGVGLIHVEILPLTITRCMKERAQINELKQDALHKKEVHDTARTGLTPEQQEQAAKEYNVCRPRRPDSRCLT